jgi:hypothetical protein
MTYSEILARLETATGPDREIDCMIGYAVDWTPNGGVPFREICAETEGGYANVARRYACPHYTASLNAVVALIESELPGWVWEVKGPTDPLANVWRLGDFLNTAIKKKGATPPLALLTAAVRVLWDKEAA